MEYIYIYIIVFTDIHQNRKEQVDRNWAPSIEEKLNVNVFE